MTPADWAKYNDNAAVKAFFSSGQVRSRHGMRRRNAREGEGGGRIGRAACMQGRARSRDDLAGA